MKRGPSLRSWVVATILGGGLAIFLDPDMGRRRRYIARDKVRSFKRRVSKKRLS